MNDWPSAGTRASAGRSRWAPASGPPPARRRWPASGRSSGRDRRRTGSCRRCPTSRPSRSTTGTRTRDSPPRDADDPERVLLEVRDRPAVGRPERIVRALGVGEQRAAHGAKRLHPQLAGTLKATWEPSGDSAKLWKSSFEGGGMRKRHRRACVGRGARCARQPERQAEPDAACQRRRRPRPPASAGEPSATAGGGGTRHVDRRREQAGERELELARARVTAAAGRGDSARSTMLDERPPAGRSARRAAGGSGSARGPRAPRPATGRPAGSCRSPGGTAGRRCCRRRSASRRPARPRTAPAPCRAACRRGRRRRCRPRSSRTRPVPKSISTMRPLRSRITFCALTSRCSRPAECTAASASQTSTPMSAASRALKRPCSCRSSSSVAPSMSSIQSPT